MASRSEHTPFLGRSNTDDDYEENHPIQKLPANQYFRRAINIFSAISSVLSIAICGVLIAAHVIIQAGPFTGYTFQANEATRDLAIVCLTTFIVSIPTIFLQLPIIITLLANFTMSIVLLVFSAVLFENGWPTQRYCEKWDYRTGHFLPATPQCLEALERVRIFVGIGAGFGIVIGLLLMAASMLRLIAIFNTKFWEGKTFKGFKPLRGWNPTGFELSFTMKVVRVLPKSGSAPAVEEGREEESRLIET